MSELQERLEITAEPRPASARVWLKAVRPATLSAALVPVLLGAASAFHLEGFRLGPALGALCGALFLQIGANLANDVFDFEKGADTAERLGPLRVVQAGLLSPNKVRSGMWVAFLFATLAGVYLTLIAGPVIVAIGLASIVSAVAYTAGPYPLGYRGLGDVFVFVFFGPVAVCGTVLVQLGTVPALPLLASVAIGALATNILVVNNVRDRHTDARADKRTLVVRFGRRAGVIEYTSCLVLALLSVLSMPLLAGTGVWPLLPLFVLPMGFRLLRELVTRDGAALNETLVGSARFLLIFGVLFAAGTALDRLLSNHGLL